MDESKTTFVGVTIKTVITYTVTYFIFGVLASTIFDYGTLFATTSLNLLMRPTSDPMVMAGPLFQPIRGLLFGIVFFLLRDILFGRKNGWLVMWIMLVFVGILGTFGPTPGSIEGMVYTTIPLAVQLIGLPEVVIQALVFSGVLFYWVTHPQKRWLKWTMAVAFFIVLVLPVLGLLVGPQS